MVDVDRGGWVRVGGTWKRIDPADSAAGIWCRVGGSWKVVEASWVRVSGTWKQWYPTEDETEPPPTGPSPGTYILSATSYSIPPINGQDSWAYFNTTPYQGFIDGLKARISWGAVGSPSMNVYGRNSGSYYRNIAQDAGWANRTIDHDISQGLSQFNSGSATGYTLRPVDTNVYPPTYVQTMRLVIVVN